MFKSLKSEPKSSLELQAQALKVLQGLPVEDAIGAACSFLLYSSYNHRIQFRRVMNEKVIREGFSGISLLEQFNRVSKEL